MTYSTWTSRGRGALQVATLLLAAAPVAFSGEQSVLTAGEGRLVGHLVVTATRLPSPSAAIAHLGAITVTASRDALLADLGSMTVTAHRVVVFADLGSMTVSAYRVAVFARNETPRSGQAAF